MSKTRYIPGRDTQAYQILSLIAISGELPNGQIRRLSGGGRYKEEIIKRLKSKNLIHVYYHDKLRGLRLTSTAKQLLLSENEHRFSFYLTGRSETSEPTYHVSRRPRLHRIAETYVTMHNAGIAVYRDAKPVLFAPGGYDADYVAVPSFYSSREIKELGTETVKIHGARTVRTIFAESGIFIVYKNKQEIPQRFHPVLFVFIKSKRNDQTVDHTVGQKHEYVHVKVPFLICIAGNN